MTHQEESGNIPAKPVTVTINGKPCPAKEGEILLLVAEREKIAIPHLCHEPSLEPYGACRLCLIELVKTGKREMATACTVRATDGLVVETGSPEIDRHRSILFELYLAEAPGSDTIRALAARYGVKKTRFLKKTDPADPLGSKCVLCGLCVRICGELMGAGAIGFINRGPYTFISTPFLEPSADCSGCGACAKVCPTGAIVFGDEADTRVMKSWNRTTIPLVECSGCGKPFAPAELAARTLSAVDPHLDREIAGLCPACRGKRIAKLEISGGRGGSGSHG